MTKTRWLLTSTFCLAALPVYAQEPTPAPEAQAAATAEQVDTGEIIVTATRRNISLSDVPLAVSAVSGEALRNSGISDIRGLNQLSASLNVSSTVSEATGGVARIRGVGTVGDNPGLESSVATFIDGVYRSRSGVALTELGPVDRIEVLRGPQGTLFGRNASSGLINVITEGPGSTEGGTASLSYGNYDYWRGELGLTGPIGDKVAYRIDGVYLKRDGFLKDSNNYPGSTKRDFNDRNRYLIRGQLKFEPTDAINVRLIADYAKRNENCCAATFLPATQKRLVAGQIVTQPNAFAGLERTLGAVINDDTFARKVSVTPDRSFQSDVEDWGISGELNWDLGGAKLTSITAYRNWRSDRAQDADFTNLDMLYRTNYDQEFKTFTQELRLQGKAFGNVLDWLVGGYFADETLNLFDDLRFGRDYGLLQGCRIAAAISPTNLQPGQPGCLTPAAHTALSGALGPIITGLDNLAAIGDSGATNDRFKQKDRTWALFTHNVINVTDQLTLTLGARYTHDRKKVDMSLVSDSNVCATQRALLGPVLLNPASSATARALATNLVGLSCVNNIPGTGTVDGSYSDQVSDNEWTGTAVLSFKPTDRLMTYASYSKGYKAGGYNLDRAGLLASAPNPADLRFAAEKVDAFEVGAKYRGHGFRVAATVFYEMFKDFQLNTFNGVSYAVENIEGCSALAGGSGADSDLAPAAAAALSGACAGKEKAGVISKGFELEGSFSPSRYFTVDAGFTYARSRYRNDVTAVDGDPLPIPLFYIPGRALSNAPEYTVVVGTTWTPPLGSGGLNGLVHADVRSQSNVNTGSDLLPEKLQTAVAVVNARLGVSGKEGAWSLEFWGQNIFNRDYRQVVAGAPIQGSNSIANIQGGGATLADTLYIVFPAEPRTYGLTVRTKF
jgi:outer membrane receptor protein involved in Fe transport